MTIPGALQLADLEPVGPGTPAGRYLRRFWHPVIRARDVGPGKAKPIEVLSEKFTLYRGEDGTPHLVAFRCAHRGTQLSVGWIEGSALRCRYHGWKFDATGQCVEQPNEDKPFCARVRIPSYPVREQYGLIFAYLGEGEPPAFQHFPDLDQPGVIIPDPPEILPCSFWNKMDNDPGHIPWAHRASHRRAGRTGPIPVMDGLVEQTAYGVRTSTPGSRSHHRFIMPTIRQFWQRTRAKGFENRRDVFDTKTVWTVPINDRTFASFDVTHTRLEGDEARAYAAVRADVQEAEDETRWALAKKILAGEMTLEELPQGISGYTSFSIEDYVTQVGQGPVLGRGREQLGRNDTRVLLIRRLWLQEVAALLEERPLTEWTVPSEPEIAAA